MLYLEGVHARHELTADIMHQYLGVSEFQRMHCSHMWRRHTKLHVVTTAALAASVLAQPDGHCKKVQQRPQGVSTQESTNKAIFNIQFGAKKLVS